MKKLPLLVSLFSLHACLSSAQTNAALPYFPQGTRLFSNIAYAGDTLYRHQLDIYLPARPRKAYPVILWIHSGGWRMGSKTADMHDLRHTLEALMKNGYAVVAINYRYSTTAIFPAQIQDCNQAMAFVYENAGKYQLDTAHIALMGFSAGGHLAALMGVSANNRVPDFYADGKKPGFKISAVVDYYGLSDFYLRPAAEHRQSTSGPGLLFGGAMVDKPALVHQATPLTYIDGDDPPFLILHGNKDELMDVRQSIRLDSALRSQGVMSQLMIIDGAPHGGELFDTEAVRSAIISFLNKHLK